VNSYRDVLNETTRLNSLWKGEHTVGTFNLKSTKSRLFSTALCLSLKSFLDSLSNLEEMLLRSFWAKLGSRFYLYLCQVLRLRFWDASLVNRGLWEGVRPI
jgi:hypothetical protein